MTYWRPDVQHTHTLRDTAASVCRDGRSTGVTGESTITQLEHDLLRADVARHGVVAATTFCDIVVRNGGTAAQAAALTRQFADTTAPQQQQQSPRRRRDDDACRRDGVALVNYVYLLAHMRSLLDGDDDNNNNNSDHDDNDNGDDDETTSLRDVSVSPATPPPSSPPPATAAATAAASAPRAHAVVDARTRRPMLRARCVATLSPHAARLLSRCMRADASRTGCIDARQLTTALRRLCPSLTDTDVHDIVAAFATAPSSSATRPCHAHDDSGDNDDDDVSWPCAYMPLVHDLVAAACRHAAMPPTSRLVPLQSNNVDDDDGDDDDGDSKCASRRRPVKAMAATTPTSAAVAHSSTTRLARVHARRVPASAVDDDREAERRGHAARRPHR